MRAAHVYVILSLLFLVFDSTSAQDAHNILPVARVRTAAEESLFTQRYPALNSLLSDSRTIPGLNTDYVPQGMCWIKSGEQLAITYYAKSRHGPSILTTVDWKSGRVVGTFSLHNNDGTQYYGHVGGVAVSETSVWTGGDGELLRFPIPESGLTGSGILKSSNTFQLDSSVSSVTLHDNTLWAAEFSHPIAGYSPAKHHRGRDKRAWVAGYDIDPRTELLTATETYRVGKRHVLKPDRVILTRDKVQAICFCRDAVVLSISFSAFDSKLAIYRKPFHETPIKVRLPGGSQTLGFVVDSNNHLKTVVMPAGSEGIGWNGKTLAILFEGGSKHYRKRWRRLGAMIEDRILILDLERLIANE